MTHDENVDELAAFIRGDLLTSVALARLLLKDMATDEDLWEVGNPICVAAFGERVECPNCASMVLPGFLCWDCEDWTASTTAATSREEGGRPPCGA